jgi:hypothetical protein
MISARAKVSVKKLLKEVEGGGRKSGHFYFVIKEDCIDVR